jgi:hypothetical protein
VLRRAEGDVAVDDSVIKGKFIFLLHYSRGHQRKLGRKSLLCWGHHLQEFGAAGLDSRTAEKESQRKKERERERERDLIRGENKKCSTWRKERLDEQEEKS